MQSFFTSPILKTAWAIPGKGARISELLAACGSVIEGHPYEELRTSLILVAPGQIIDEIDRRRCDEAIRQARAQAEVTP